MHYGFNILFADNAPIFLAKEIFEEAIRVGPFSGEKIDRAQFEQLKQRFYRLTGLNSEGTPALAWHQQLAETATGFALRVDLPRALPGAPEKAIVIDQPVTNVIELRRELKRRLPEASADLDDQMLNVAVNGHLLLSSEGGATLASGDRVTLVPIFAGG